jgi:predicted nucleotidyltransferase component of viral defense system
MIPKNFIIQWSAFAPWQFPEQIEQDLIITTALLKIYQHPILREKFAFRGGTALNKLYFNPPTRYSEDIDLVQIASEPIGPAIAILRDVMNSWLGSAKKAGPSLGNFTLPYRTTSDNNIPLKLKIEINSREHFSILGYKDVEFSSMSEYFPGHAHIKTYALEELLGTKLRALYQRRKGRDLYDLYVALTKFPNLNIDAIIQCFKQYLMHTHQSISAKQFHDNMMEKLKNKEFTQDTLPLLSQQVKQFNAEEAYVLIAAEIINKL